MKKIYIDAGHGGKDSGAVGYDNRLEKNDTLRMSKALTDEMKKRGWEVLTSRTGDTYPSLNERADAANAYKADVFVSLHRNAYSDITSNGGEVLYAPNASKTSMKLAENVCSRMNKAGGFKHRGAKQQRATVLQRSKMPAITVEAGFVTNQQDNMKFDDKFKQIISAIADGIEEVMTGVITTTPIDNKKYKLLPGAHIYAFSKNANGGEPVELIDYKTSDEYAQIYLDGDECLVKWKYLTIY